MKRVNKVLGKKQLFIALTVLVAFMIVGLTWAFSGPKKIDESEWLFDDWEEDVGYNDSGKVDLIISSTADWQSFVDKVNNGTDYADCVVQLNVDLNFEEFGNMLPVGTEQFPFRGIFDGNNHTIANLTMSSQDKYVGLFAVVEYAEIKNLNLQDCIIYADEAIGTGGIAGCAESSTISYCSVDGEVFSRYGSVGGVVGNNRSEIYNCSVKGSVVGSSVSGSYGDTSYGTGGDFW